MLFLLRNLSELVAFKHQDCLILVVFSSQTYKIKLFCSEKLEHIPATIFRQKEYKKALECFVWIGICMLEIIL